jgi:hypothetical protein
MKKKEYKKKVTEAMKSDKFRIRKYAVPYFLTYIVYIYIYIYIL